MRDPELRTPEEWAEELRAVGVGHKPSTFVWEMTRTDVEDLADLMDDLAEALRLLRTAKPTLYKLLDARIEWEVECNALLAKYDEKEDGR